MSKKKVYIIMKYLWPEAVFTSKRKALKALARLRSREIPNEYYEYHEVWLATKMLNPKKVWSLER